MTAYLGLGANAADRLAALRSAVGALEDRAGRVVAFSFVYQTEAWVLPGAPPQRDHLNAVAAVETDLEVGRLLEVVQQIERDAGRDPAAPRWSPRPLDIDVLLYGDLEVARPGLTVPHPALADRRFVLVPLADVAPGLEVVGTGATVADLLERCSDTLRVERTDLSLR